MADTINVQQVQGLMELMGVNHHEEQDYGSLPSNTSVRDGKKSQAPANMKVKVKTKEDLKKEVDAKKAQAEKIFDDEDFRKNDGMVVKDDGDDRPTPDYEILFKQTVGGIVSFISYIVRKCTTYSTFTFDIMKSSMLLTISFCLMR